MGEALIGAGGAILGALLTIVATLISGRVQRAFQLDTAREAGAREVALAWRRERLTAYKDFIAIVGHLEAKLERVVDGLSHGESFDVSAGYNFLAPDLTTLFDAMGEVTLVGGDAIEAPAVEAVSGLLLMEAEVANRLRESAGEDLAPLELDRFGDIRGLSRLGDFRMAAREDLGVPAASLAPAHLQQG